MSGNKAYLSAILALSDKSVIGDTNFLLFPLST